MTKAGKEAKAITTVLAGYTESITGIKNHDQLKVVGAAIANDETLSNELRTEIVKIYRAKRNVLDWQMVKFSRNNNFKKLLFSINTLTAETCSAVGKTIYAMTHDVDEKGASLLNRHEADLCYRSYWKQKNKLEEQVPAGAAA